METMEYVGTNIYDDSRYGKTKIEYFLTMEQEDGRELYGIYILKSVSNTNLILEKEKSAWISSSRSFVMGMLQKFVRNLVTPVEMYCLIDEFVTIEMEKGQAV